MKFKSRLIRVKQYGFVLIVFWTLVVAASLIWNITAKDQNIEEMARIYGRSVFERDVLYRQWVSALGGVYAEVGPMVTPNPYLAAVKGRDIPLPDGRMLTLLNPAYMTRMVSELAESSTNGLFTHITSLRPIRPGNAADPWEIRALKQLEQGVAEVSEIQVLSGEEVMRVMAPLLKKEACLKCHPASESPVGSIVGGITESIRLSPLRELSKSYFTGVVAFHGGIWVLGMALVWAGAARIANSQRNIALLLYAVEQSPVSIIITDLEGNIQYVNPKFCEATGYSYGEVMGKNPRILRSEFTGQSEYKDLWEAITTRESWRGEFHNRRKDGSLFWESASISPILTEDGLVEYYIAIKEDISEKKEVELNLVKAKEDAEAASKVKSQFLAIVSHELRTPLNAIIGFSETLKLMFELIPDSRERDIEYIGYVLEGANGLLQIINDILDLSRIEAGKHPLSDAYINLPNVINTCLRMVRARADAASIELKTEGIETVQWLFVDERALRQALLNLLSNAVKFTSTGGQVTVRVSSAVDGGPIIAVIDTGIGIAADDLPKVLEPFGQVDNELTRSHNGTGLGLSVTNSLIKLEDGTLEIESEPGHGTTVSIRFAPSRLPQAPQA